MSFYKKHFSQHSLLSKVETIIDFVQFQENLLGFITSIDFLSKCLVGKEETIVVKE